jgi:hypothetical protein
VIQYYATRAIKTRAFEVVAGLPIPIKYCGGETIRQLRDKFGPDCVAPVIYKAGVSLPESIPEGDNAKLALEVRGLQRQVGELLAENARREAKINDLVEENRRLQARQNVRGQKPKQL